MQLRAKLVRVCGGGGGLGAWVDPDPGDLPGSHFITGRAPRAATFRFQAGKVVRALSVYFLHRAALILTTPIGMPHKKRFCDSARGSRLRAGATLGWNFFCSRTTFCNSRPRAARCLLLTNWRENFGGAYSKSQGDVSAAADRHVGAESDAEAWPLVGKFGLKWLYSWCFYLSSLKY